MSNEERLQQILEVIMKIDREQATLIERMHSFSSNLIWLEERIDKVDQQMRPVTWASQTGAVLLWVCALLGGVGTVLGFAGKL